MLFNSCMVWKETGRRAEMEDKNEEEEDGIIFGDKEEIEGG